MRPLRPSNRAIVLAALLTGAIAGSTTWTAPMRAGGPRPPAGPAIQGLDLLIEVAGTDVVVLRAWPAAAPPNPGTLRPPAITAETYSTLEPGSAELVLSILDAGGRVLASFGWPAGSESFFDGRIGERRIGGAVDHGDDVRILSSPLPRGAAFLFFSTSEVVARPESAADAPLPGEMAGSFERRADPSGGPGRQPRALIGHRSALYSLLPDPGGMLSLLPPLPIPGPPLPPVPLPGPTPDPRWLHLQNNPDPLRVSAEGRLEPRCGRITGREYLVYQGDPSTHFDIVVLGDGFDASTADQDKFKAKSKELVDGILATEPYKGMHQQQKINVYRINTISSDSGIKNCPAPGVAKCTYYRSEGHFNGKLYGGYCGTFAPWIVYDAADDVAPIGTIELMIVLANCNGDGGSAFPRQKTAFVTMNSLAWDFVEVGAHEAAHVIADLADEYIGCSLYQPWITHPNLAVAATASALPTYVPWTALAQSRGDLNPDGTFKAVHRYGDPPIPTTGGGSCAPTDPCLQGRVGLFWGCQYADGNTGTCDPWSDPRGARFYRPMARCKMRYSTNPATPFCAVCSQALTDAIINAAP